MYHNILHGNILYCTAIFSPGSPKETIVRRVHEAVGFVRVQAPTTARLTQFYGVHKGSDIGPSRPAGYGELLMFWPSHKRKVSDVCWRFAVTQVFEASLQFPGVESGQWLVQSQVGVRGIGC